MSGEQVVTFLKGFDIHTILSLIGIVWIFYSKLKAEMKLIEGKMDRQGERIDRLYQMFVDLLKKRK